MNRKTLVPIILLFSVLPLGCLQVSQPEAEVNTVTVNTGTTGCSPVPFAGVELIDQVTATSARVHWTTNACASAYLVWNTTSGSQVFAGYADSSLTSFVVSGLQPVTFYKLRVQMTDSTGAADGNAVDLSFTTGDTLLP